MSTKRSENLDDEQHFRLRDLLRYNLKSVRAYLLKEAFQQRTGTLLASCPSPNLPTISSDEPNRKPHFLWWSSRAEALGYKTRKSPGCSCRALLFEVLTAWHWDTLGAYTSEYPTHPRGCLADDTVCSAASNLRNLPENIVRISGGKTAAHYNKEMHGIGRGRGEIKLLGEAPRFVVFRVDREGADACDVGALKRALHRVLQERLSHATACPRRDARGA